MQNLTFIFSYPFIVILFIYLSKKYKFLDYPGLKKVHREPVVNTLGTIMYSFLFLIIVTNEFSYEIELIIAYGLILVIVGFIDDIYNLTPGMKILFKSLPVTYLLLNGFSLENIGHYEFIGTIHLNKFNFIFLFFSCLMLINSFNYIDGIDGLNLSISITAMLFFTFLSDPDAEYIALFKLIIYLMFLTLIFNLLPTKLKFKAFIGNAGSLFIGFFFSFLIIHLYKKHNIHPSILIWACWLPTYDFCYVTLKRLLQKKNLFEKDYEHIHHKLLFKFKSNSNITLLFINIINILVILFAYTIFLNLGKIYSLITFIVLFPIYSLLSNKLKTFE